MVDLDEFVSKRKSMLVAPAGYGKTYTIAESLKRTILQGKQLVLTHTHAGVSSIKEKIRKEGIRSTAYCTETITSFAQKYVLSFYTGNDIPDQADSKNYYPFILSKAIELFKLNPIRQVISNTYKGLFVDEYQDCTIKQHELVLLLSELFPTHILGDFLQGIFDFHGEPIVNMEDSTQMSGFADAKYELEQPHRWMHGNNDILGKELQIIRERLINKEEIDLTKYKSINTYSSQDILREHYTQIIKLLDSEKNILVLDPVSTNINSRIHFIQQFKNIPRMIESIDDKDFYNISKELDLITTDNFLKKVLEISNILFNKTGLAKWFNDNGLKRKIKVEDKTIIRPLEEKLLLLEKQLSFSILAEIFRVIRFLPDIKCYRKELFSSVCKALDEAENNQISVFEAMTNQRNTIRRMGKKLHGKCIGTTLLTKGLEFDTVAIINAQKFDSPKHLYVALTRASKRLFIFTENTTLNPY